MEFTLTLVLSRQGGFARQLQSDSKAGKKNKDNDGGESSDEDGKSAIKLLLYCLSAINLLIFGLGLCWLAVRHSYIITPIAFIGMVLFAFLALSGKPRKKSTQNTTTKSHYPDTLLPHLQNSNKFFVNMQYPYGTQNIRMRPKSIATRQMRERTAKTHLITHLRGGNNGYYRFL